MRVRRGSQAVARKTSQVSSEAPSAAVSTPSFASRSSSPSKASEAISSETVKPIPATAPPPAVATQPTGGLTRPRLSLLASQAMPVTPTGLPST